MALPRAGTAMPRDASSATPSSMLARSTWPTNASRIRSAGSSSARALAARSGVKIAVCASSLHESPDLPSVRSERANSGSRRASGIRVVVRGVAGKDEKGERGRDTGALPVPKRKVRQAFGREAPARQAEPCDGSLDRLGRAFYFHQVIHARIVFESHHGTMELVLRDVAIDLDGDAKAEPLENGDECVGVADPRFDLFTELVAFGPAGRALPVQLRARGVLVSVDADAQHVIAHRERAVVEVVPAVLETSLEDENTARALDGRAADCRVVDDALQLDLEHVTPPEWRA